MNKLLINHILKRIMQGIIAIVVGVSSIILCGIIAFMIPIGFMGSLGIFLLFSLVIAIGVFAYFEYKLNDKNKPKKQILL